MIIPFHFVLLTVANYTHQQLRRIRKKKVNCKKVWKKTENFADTGVNWLWTSSTVEIIY